MESLQLLLGGFATALQPTNLVFAFIGCFLGTLIGVLPGVGPATGMAILIPLTFVLEPTPAIIMLAALFYGTMYGGTITSVLMNVPGEAASAVTTFEGYPMAKQGRAGAALSIAAIGSFIGGTISAIGLVLMALPLSRFALVLGPPEMSALIVMALCVITVLAGKSLIRGGISACLGLLIASVGTDPVLGAPRFAFGKVELLDGFGIVTIVMGMFGIGEILLNAENPARQVFDTSGMKTLIPTRQDLKDSLMPILRGTGIGFILGIIPGLGATPATFLSYAAEKKLSKTPERFGHGAIEGVAGPETANNACANAHLVPLFSLGIPTSSSVAILMGALIINGLTPGPDLFRDHGDFVWAIIASLYIGNVILLVLNLPLIPMWVALLKVPYSILFAIILAFIVVGAYTVNNSAFDVGAVLGFGILGYLLRKLDIPPAPLIVTLILTPMLERALRQSLQMSQGDFGIFVSRPISVILLLLAVAFLASAFIKGMAALRTTGEED